MPDPSDKTLAGVNVAELRMAMPELPCDDNAALVFGAPWEAHAFAMTLALHERGMFTWPEWAAYLNQSIRDAQASGDPDRGDTYYTHWLTALERISVAKGLLADDKLLQRRTDWELAARRTPHGQPIELTRGQS